LLTWGGQDFNTILLEVVAHNGIATFYWVCSKWIPEVGWLPQTDDDIHWYSLALDEVRQVYNEALFFCGDHLKKDS
jgi:hypothetical protein